GGGAQLGLQQLDRLLLVQRAQQPAQLPDDLQLVRLHQDLLAAGAGGVHVHRGEHPLVRQLAGQPQLHVPGALELLEDHLVHLRAGLHQRRGEDGQRTAVLDVPGGAEELLRWVERRGVHAAGEDPAGGGSGQVVGTGQPGERVEQHHHVLTELDQPLGALDRQLGHDRVVGGGTVEGGGDHLALDRALHVGDFLGTFVHEHHHQVHVRVVRGDRIGDLLHDDRLASLRRRDDQSALALADRRHQVHDPGGELPGGGLQPEPLLRVQRGELGELRPTGGLRERDPVDRVQPHQRIELLPVVALPLAGLTDRTGDGVPAAQRVLLHLAEGDVHVVGPGQVAAGAHERLVRQAVPDSGPRAELVVLGDLALFLGPAAAALAVPVPVPVAAAPTPSAGPVVVTTPGPGVLGLVRVDRAPLRELDIVQRWPPALGLLTSRGAVDGGALAVVATVTVLLRLGRRLLVLAALAALAALVGGLLAVCALALVAAGALTLVTTLVSPGLVGSGPVLSGASALGTAGRLPRVPLRGQVG